MYFRADGACRLARQDINDGSSANVSPPRKNYSVVAKEMAKTQSLAASFRNISNYLSLIERARQYNTRGSKINLKELDAPSVKPPD